MEQENSVVEKICAIRKEFDKLMSSHADDTGFADSISAALNEHEMLTEEEIKSEYAKNHDLDRLLRIGIVGAVKAGKSSLLNALFFDGKDILPKAATPMTAALTELSYGETCEVAVDFFTDADVEVLKQQAANYERLLKEIKNKKLKEAEENWLKAKKRREPDFKGSADADTKKTWQKTSEESAVKEMNRNVGLAGAYQQYESIKNASVPRKTESEVIAVSSIDEIAGKLEDYVGSGGKYMPFTRSVSIKLPIDALRGVCVVDTPGFNDPVPSRDERARKALGDCNVILILSRSGQFLTENDKEVISKITKKDGIRELYIIQSQIDSQLFGIELKDEVNGDLDRAVKTIVSKLNATVGRNLSSINSDGAFTELINEPEKRTYPTSGLCESMSRSFTGRDSWDSGKKTAWNNLKRDYPDYFSDNDENTSIASLKKLGNIEPINSCVASVKSRKEEIFINALADFERKYCEKAKDVKNSVLEYIESREKKLEERDIKSLEAEIKNLQNVYDRLAPEMEEAFVETVMDWYDSVKSDYETRLASSRGEAKDSIATAQGEYTETWTTRGGFLWLRKDYHSRQVTTLNLAAVKSSFDDYISDYNSALPHFLNSEIYRLTKKVLTAVQKIWVDGNPSSDDSLVELRNKIRRTLSEMNFKYDLEYTGAGFNYDSGYYSNSSKLEGSSAEECISQANAFVSELNRNFRGILNNALDDVLEKCKNANFSKKVLDSYIKQLEKSKADLETPKLAIENFKRMKKEVEAIKC